MYTQIGGDIYWLWKTEISVVFYFPPSVETTILSRLQMDTLRKIMGTRIKFLRKNRGLTQADLAEKTGFEPNAISRYETGSVSPSVDNLLILAEKLDVSPMEILPPPIPTAQRLFILRQELTEKGLHIGSQQGLEELIRLADTLISPNRTKDA